MPHPLRFLAHVSFLGAAIAVAMGGCTQRDLSGTPGGTGSTSDASTRALRSQVDTIVVIYAENRAFDNLYGNFPGARGLSEVIDGTANLCRPINRRWIATAPCCPFCRRHGAA